MRWRRDVQAGKLAGREAEADAVVPDKARFGREVDKGAGLREDVDVFAGLPGLEGDESLVGESRERSAGVLSKEDTTMDAEALTGQLGRA